MADNIDKALNGLDLKTDSLPSDWMITLVNPKEGIPAQNMTIARFTELVRMIYFTKANPFRQREEYLLCSIEKAIFTAND